MNQPTARQPIGPWVGSLAARQATPGGGAAAAVAAAIGAAVGAMAARYTTGKKWADRAEQATALAEALEEAAKRCLALADEDAAAYTALQASWKDQSQSDAEKAAIAAWAQGVPAGLIATCAEQAEALAGFLEACNPMIVSDAKAGIHLLAGAGRAAWQTLLVNQPDDVERARAAAHLATLARCEEACG